MASIGSTRIAPFWALLTSEERARITHGFDAGTTEDEILAALSNIHDIRERIDHLTDTQRDMLERVVFEPELLFSPFDSLEPKAPVLLDELLLLGLAFPVHYESAVLGWIAPLEVRFALVEEDDLTEADLALVFAHYDADELESLARLHGVTLTADAPSYVHGEQVALALLNPMHAEELVHSLTPTSRSLIMWLFQREGAVATHIVEDWLNSDRDTDEEASGAALHVLLRLGLIQSMTFHDVSLTTITSDLRGVLSPILSAFFDQACTHAWTELRDQYQQGFRDNFPRGRASAPLQYARYRVLRAVGAPPDPLNPTDRLLSEFFLFDTEKRTVGELASYFLDVNTNEAFARHILRIWCRSLSDLYTRQLIRAFGGESETIAQWLLQQRQVDIESAGAELPEESEDDLPFSGEQQLWPETLMQFKGIILIALGALQDTAWYSMEKLNQLIIAIYRRTIWQYGRFHLFPDDFPWDALPVETEELNETHTEALRETLDVLFLALLEPIGAAQRDASGKYFIINNEAFRTFRDNDPGFDGLWEAADAFMGEDADLWLPLPIEVGIGPTGSHRIQWYSDGSASLSADAAIVDLVRLAEWGDVIWEGTEFRFKFSPKSFEGEFENDELEEFLVWLAARTRAPLPEVFRVMVPVTNSAADQDLEHIDRAARAYVVRSYNALEVWADAPSLSLMEELRSWGESIEHFLVAELQTYINDANYDDARLRHIAILLSEIGITSVHAALHHVFLHCVYESQEGAVGSSLARMGEPAYPAMVRTFNDATRSVEKRLAAAGTLASMAILHPHLADRVFQELRRAARDEEIGDDIATILCAHCAEIGHRESESLIREVRDQGRWVEDTLPHEDALWIASIAPAVWGHPIYAAPLAQLFPNRWESEEFLRISGINDVIAETEIDTEHVLGKPGNWRRKG